MVFEVVEYINIKIFERKRRNKFSFQIKYTRTNNTWTNKVWDGNPTHLDPNKFIIFQYGAWEQRENKNEKNTSNISSLEHVCLMHSWKVFFCLKLRCYGLPYYQSSKRTSARYGWYLWDWDRLQLSNKYKKRQIINLKGHY